MSVCELTLDLGELIRCVDCRVDYDAEIGTKPCINKVEVRAVRTVLASPNPIKEAYWMDISDLIQNDELLLKQVEEFVRSE